jgi:hypothetical protein
MPMKLLLGLAVLFTAAQDPAKVPPAVSQKEIDSAILKGAEFLKTAPSPGGHLKTNCDELILLTLIHAGISEKGYDKFLQNCLDRPLEHTYKVALLAMCLEELDATKHQLKIAQCAQFLVDNQASNGQWSYGRPTDAVKGMVPTAEAAPVASGVDKSKKGSTVREFGDSREHKRPKTSIAVKQTRTVGDKGDNSNSQYAALGLRACFDANIKLPEEVLQKARTWWVDSQGADESGAAKAVGKNAVSSSGEVPFIQGWNYQKASEEGAPTSAMTAGAVGATVIYEYMLGRDWHKDRVTRAGVNWLGKHYSINENYYYMYALERAGMLYNTELFGGHNWYYEGARFLVDHQAADGSWGKRENKDENTWDTCFAVLFLKKATRAIATEGGGSRK